MTHKDSIKFAAGSGLKIICLGSRHITVPTSNAAASIRRKIGRVNDRKLVVIPNPIDLKVFASGTSIRKESTFYPEILAVGNLGYRKGFNVLIKAFAGVLKHFENAHLTIVGRGPRQTELVQLAKDFKIENRVQFLTGLSDEELVDVYNSLRLVCTAL